MILLNRDRRRVTEDISTARALYSSHGHRGKRTFNTMQTQFYMYFIHLYLCLHIVVATATVANVHGEQRRHADTCINNETRHYAYMTGKVTAAQTPKKTKTLKTHPPI